MLSNFEFELVNAVPVKLSSFLRTDLGSQKLPLNQAEDCSSQDMECAQISGNTVDAPDLPQNKWRGVALQP